MQRLVLRKVLIVLAVAVLPTASPVMLRCRSVPGEAKKICEHLCPDGYEARGRECVSLCPDGCPANAGCVGKDKCGCRAGFVADRLLGVCKPSCKPACGANAYCHQPNECRCQTGYEAANHTGSAHCAPVCQPACGPKQHCVKPGRCACIPGHVLLTSGECEPLCSAGCGDHERCADVERCDCKPGFQRDPAHGKCVPHCSRACGAHGECVAPETCKCAAGFNMTADGCEPHCAPACGQDQHCFDANVCRCNDGFKPIGAPNRPASCEPSCTPPCGEHQYCYKPNVCACIPGFAQLAGGDCVATCSQRCGAHEFCKDVELCDCRPGYARSALDGTCQLHCDPACPADAECRGPQRCVCPAGSSLVNGACRPECSPVCDVHATCVAPNVCKCLNGSPYDLSQRHPCHALGRTDELRSCFKDYHILIARIQLHCETSALVIYLIYGCVFSLPLVGVFLALHGYRKIGPKCQKHAQPANAAAEYVITYQPTIIQEMNRLGMMVDLSHVSTGTMRDALEVSEAPVIFSHSSAYELCNSSRNVQDDMLQSLAKNGGLVMVNFYSKFLSCSENSTVHDAVAHINHIKRIAGIDHVGLGAGYDGINFTPKGLEDVSSYPTLFAELLGGGWSIDDLTKLAGGNFLRVMKEVEKIRDDKKAAGIKPFEDHPNFRTEDPYNCTSS